MNLDALAVQERITAYLTVGGLFNPELANHDAVRDLLIDARAALAQARADALEKAASVCDSVNNHDNPMTANDCAAAIRAEMETIK